MKVLLSDDIETNPGPIENIVSNSISFFPQNSMLLATRLYRHGLRPLDICEGGDCFFWAVAHQLYGDPKFHLNIRALGVQYPREHPGLLKVIVRIPGLNIFYKYDTATYMIW